MIYKQCPRCGKRIPEGTSCEVCRKRRHREYNQSRTGSKRVAFYSSEQWRIVRRLVAERFLYLDIYSLFVYKKIEYGETVHHIVPLEDDWNLRSNKYNLIYLTESNHQTLHNRMKKGEKSIIIRELQSLVRRWIDQGEGGNVLEVLSPNAALAFFSQNSK